ncbi:hypothetical protein BUALT_Bualt11G0019800 [Buddleja alternifolia]|uniref:MULE transposase domain-containing protein n=1 Tax=Buddleja alternifolia TaxID=168488 RepID=A0AAV6WRW6_9LAMI|nr:hypothetical protein BUALT_Bualt11G0019800 [Buddleja alternifolia]
MILSVLGASTRLRFSSPLKLWFRSAIVSISRQVLLIAAILLRSPPHLLCFPRRKGTWSTIDQIQNPSTVLDDTHVSSRTIVDDDTAARNDINDAGTNVPTDYGGNGDFSSDSEITNNDLSHVTNTDIVAKNQQSNTDVVVRKSGRNGYRSLLLIDRTFRNEHYKLTILSAVAIDTNNQMFPLAFSVVLGKTQANWFWFLLDLKIVIGEGLTIISDRHKGLLDIVPEFSFLNCYHVVYVHRLIANLMNSLSDKVQKETKQIIKNLVYASAKSLKVEEFNKNMNRIK